MSVSCYSQWITQNVKQQAKQVIHEGRSITKDQRKLFVKIQTGGSRIEHKCHTAEIQEMAEHYTPRRQSKL